MGLVADRFVTTADEGGADLFARDLATGGSVWLEIGEAGDSSAQRQWMIDCDELFQVRHPALATLIDYGLLGTDRRFEAWSGDAAWDASTESARIVADAAARCLKSFGVTAAAGSMALLSSSGTPVARLSRRSAGSDRVPAADPPASSGPPAVRLIARRAVAAISEMLRHAEPRPRAAALWGPAGSGLDTAVLVLAREARLQGFVPIQASVLSGLAADALSGRSLFLIARQADDVAREFVAAALRSPRPHVCLVIGRGEVARLDGFEIGRVGRDELVAAARPADEISRRDAERAAEAAHGLPGAFVRRLWSSWSVSAPVSARSRVAEQSPAYAAVHAAGLSDAAVDAPATSPGYLPAPAEIALLRRRIARAKDLLAAGRHSPGLRLLRQAVAAQVRRRAWPDAADGGLALARELLTRGRAGDASRLLEQVREYCAQAGNAGLMADVALLAGHAWIDQARLTEAESVLRAALTGARASSNDRHAGRLACALGRTLFWRGEFAEARGVLEHALPPDGASSAGAPHRQLARIAAAEGDASRALALAEAVLRAAPALGSAQADACHTMALVRLLIGDLEGADRAVERCISAARAARRPTRVASAMLVQAEADRRRGAAFSPRRRQMLDRLARTAPPLLRLRWELVKRSLDAPDPHRIASELGSASGVRALALFASSPATGAAHGQLDPLVREMVEIVHVCQDAEEERVVLRQLCGRVRQQLHAAAAAFIAADGGRWELLAGDGPRIESDIAERTIGSGVMVGPCRVRDRLEAAVPVQYAGAPIAVLCARWTPGAGDELSRASAVLSVAATAAAPLVHAALGHRHRSALPATIGLIGNTPAVAELRRAVERAAAAPFPALVEGESGSGKELVARGIHHSGPRRDRPFCTLNCAALPDDLVESELFGHARGSFTSAISDRPGVFEEAHGGTLLLDEVGELSLRAQAKLLRVIQEGELRRIGENISRRIDVRIVCATNRDLRREAEAGRFRQDLLYRLDVIRIVVPPLRERREDVPLLVDHFWADATQRLGSRATLAAATRAALAAYDWPGNVRELQNVLAALAVRSPRRGVVPPHALPPHLAAPRRPDAFRLDAARRTFEESFVRAALVRAGGHRSRAADELGLSRQGLNKLMSRLGIR
jgi:two-component system response regulator AtoC